ncbi:MAG: ribosome small subunit-dependent GTPase A [Chloroflexi bacterium]|nr:ribosome small subunit-dependent GTPase A [Chloroflexota bacterium]
MPNEPTTRQIRALRKGQAKGEQHRQLKERRRQGLDGRDRLRGPPRRNDWGDDYLKDQFERMRRPRPRPLRVSPPGEAAADPDTEATGTVIQVRSGDSLVAWQGATIRATLPPGQQALEANDRSPLAVGDRVLLEPAGTGVARIVAVLSRRSALRRDVFDRSRHPSSSRAQVLAANIDQVIVVCSPKEPPFRPKLIDRYLVAASRDSLETVVCLNKCDLGVPDDVRADLEGYARLGVRSIRSSAINGAGLDDLRGCLRGKISIFTGHSGVGKSSLLNSLEPGLALNVAEVTQATAGQGKGRHTTASARLIPLSLPDTFVVDSPGIRAFGVRGIRADELAAHFSDIAALARACPFRDCLHRGEPGCAVAAEAQHDPFLHRRLESYRSLLAEL